MFDFLWYVEMIPTLLYWALFLAQDSCLFAAATLVATAKFHWRDWALCVGIAHCLLGYIALGITAAFLSKYLPIIYLVSICCLVFFAWHHLQHVLGRCNHDHSADAHGGAMSRATMFWRAIIFSVDSLGYGPIVMGQSAANGALPEHSHVSPLVQNAVSNGDFTKACVLMGGVGVFITILMLVSCFLMSKTSGNQGLKHHGDCCAHDHPTRKEQIIHGITALLLLSLMGQLTWRCIVGLNLAPLEIEEGVKLFWLGSSITLLGVLIASTEKTLPEQTIHSKASHEKEHHHGTCCHHHRHASPPKELIQIGCGESIGLQSTSVKV